MEFYMPISQPSRPRCLCRCRASDTGMPAIGLGRQVYTPSFRRRLIRGKRRRDMSETPRCHAERSNSAMPVRLVPSAQPAARHANQLEVW